VNLPFCKVGEIAQAANLPPNLAVDSLGYYGPLPVFIEIEISLSTLAQLHPLSG
jgi:hypothetical protein